LPTAAGNEGDASVSRWSKMGVDHFTRLGADVRAVPVIDSASANDLEHASAIDAADLIYFSGGDPGYVHQVMKDSLAWRAAQSAWARGAVYAGCSAGAMVLGREIPDFRMLGMRSISAFGILPVAFVIPHFDAIPGIWRPLIGALRRRLREDEIMIGIDEDTAIVGRLDHPWTVMGRARAHVFTKGESRVYRAGETFPLGK
jgi:cyanophycinase